MLGRVSGKTRESLTNYLGPGRLVLLYTTHFILFTRLGGTHAQVTPAERGVLCTLDLEQHAARIRGPLRPLKWGLVINVDLVW